VGWEFSERLGLEIPLASCGTAQPRSDVRNFEGYRISVEWVAGYYAEGGKW
jgi:hypothetical protein